jgi:hypothetical protein
MRYHRRSIAYASEGSRKNQLTPELTPANHPSDFVFGPLRRWARGPGRQFAKRGSFLDVHEKDRYVRSNKR